MRILLLSFYFEPDLCAGSFRNTALYKELVSILPPGSSIDVITTMPNRYASFDASAAEHESSASFSIFRVPLPVHNSGMLDQSRAFFTYAKRVMAIVKNRHYDLVYASSSRLMTAALGAWISQKKKSPLYLDIRDIFVDTIKDVLPKKLAWACKPLFSFLEKWTISKATTVNIVSEGFSDYFHSRYSDLRISTFPNGIDDEFIGMQSVPEKEKTDKKITILYAGNIGEGQGLHNIVPGLAESLGQKYQVQIIGDGGRLPQLEESIADTSNVSLFPPIGRSELIEAYRNADILFLHLNDYEAFEKVLPSKIFEYAATGKPVLAGVNGYAKEFLNLNVENSVVFKPCDVQGAVEALSQLRLETLSRNLFISKFSRVSIMEKMANDIAETAQIKL